MVLVMVVSVDSGPSDGGTPNMRSTSPSSKLFPCRMNLRGAGYLTLEQGAKRWSWETHMSIMASSTSTTPVTRQTSQNDTCSAFEYRQQTSRKVSTHWNSLYPGL
jgi:hypothetical protein